MVRLVFRPYTQFRRSICTSESLRTSIRVSPDFVLTRHSSPSFGSQRVRSGCASSRDENETPRECGAASGRGPSSLGRQPGPTFTFIAPLGIPLVPMTRVHVRLLGPCFKTGPKSTQSSSVADRYRSPRTPSGRPGGVGGTFAGLSKVNRATNSGPGPVTAPGPFILRVPWRALATASTHSRARARPRERAARARCGLIPCVYRRAAGRATGGLTRALLPATRQPPHPGRRPTPSGSRRSTRGEVHDDETPDIERTAACPRASREAPRDIAHRREASVADDESPRSIFWVS